METTERRFSWSIRQKDVLIDVGTIVAESERKALQQVLQDHKDDKRLHADKNYQITVGDTAMSVFGDEFLRAAEVSDWKGEDTYGVPHLFSSPKKKEEKDYVPIDLEWAYSTISGSSIQSICSVTSRNCQTREESSTDGFTVLRCQDCNYRYAIPSPLTDIFNYKITDLLP